jgi:hypothetical protein
MKLVALLSWYDEDPAWLARCVKSLDLVGVDHLVALDGAYELFDGPRYSPVQQVDTVLLNAPRSVDMHRWTGEGNEVEKRNRLWELAEQTEADWYMVIDSDEHVIRAPEDLKDRLTASTFDVGAVELFEPGHPLGTIVYPTFPMFFRAIPGIRCDGDHFTYRTPDGRSLWGDVTKVQCEPRTLTGVQVMHWSELRPPERRQRAKDYYKARDAAGIEDLPPPGSRLKATGQVAIV